MEKKLLPPHHCPTCNYEMDSASHGHGDKKKQPVDGSIGICMMCGEILIYQCVPGCITMRKIKPIELAEILRTDFETFAHIHRLQSTIRMVRKTAQARKN